MTDIEQRLLDDLEEAERKAWDSLKRYKFQMFGYWAAIWVHLNRVGDFKQPNPWSGLVKTARARDDDSLQSNLQIVAAWPAVPAVPQLEQSVKRWAQS